MNKSAKVGRRSDLVSVFVVIFQIFETTPFHHFLWNLNLRELKSENYCEYKISIERNRNLRRAYPLIFVVVVITVVLFGARGHVVLERLGLVSTRVQLLIQLVESNTVLFHISQEFLFQLLWITEIHHLVGKEES